MLLDLWFCCENCYDKPKNCYDKPNEIKFMGPQKWGVFIGKGVRLCLFCILLSSSHTQSFCSRVAEQIMVTVNNLGGGNSAIFIATWPRGYKIFLFMLNSTEHEIFLLINVKMPTTVGILTFMSGKNSILCLSEPIKSRIS